MQILQAFSPFIVNMMPGPTSNSKKQIATANKNASYVLSNKDLSKTTNIQDIKHDSKRAQ